MSEKGYYEPLVYIVPPEDDGILLKTVLQSRMRISRRLLSRLKQTERGITVNGERRYTDIKVDAGDRVEVRMAEESSEDILPEDIPLDILHEDEQLLILNKPPGLIVHPTHGHYTGTLANGVVHYWQAKGQNIRFRPVHRLDQETSGVLAVAKNPFVHQHISEQMKKGQVIKEYIALVHGKMECASGTVDAPIDRDPEQPHIRIVTPSGYPAVTHYVVEEAYEQGSVLRLRLETGRTHQIRVHMKHLVHPLVGDKMYGADAAQWAHTDGSIGSTDLTGVPWMERQALHACRLGFTHPGSGQPIEFNAELPDDMKRLIESWRNNGNKE